MFHRPMSAGGRRGVSIAMTIAFAIAPATAPDAFGQVAVRAVFVSNNGNLEGSVSSFTINPDLTLQFVTKLVTGMRTTTSDPCAGCNAYEISLTPNGRYLALAHPAGILDGITIVEVGPTASLTQVIQLPMGAGQDAPLDLDWLDNRYLAVLRTEPTPDQIAIYDFNPAGPSLTEVNVYTVGASAGFLVVHPSRRYLYVNNTGSPRQVIAFSIGPGGTLSQIDAELTGTPFPLELAISRDGSRLYSAGGISDGGNKVIGMDVAGDGMLALHAASPYVSPGASPSNVFVTDDGGYLIVGHGTDATMRTFTIDPGTGALTSTGNMFDVGLQGTLGDVRSMRDLVFVTDNSTAIDGVQGIYSFKLGAGGTLTMNGTIVSTTGIAPRSMATWTPVIGGDMDCDGDLDEDDVDAFVLALLDPAAWAALYPFCNIARGDLNGDTLVNGGDTQLFVDALVP